MNARALVAGAFALAGVAIVAELAATRHPSREARAAMSDAASPAFRIDEPPKPGAFAAQTYLENGVLYRYQIFFPHDYDRRRKWPTIIALHSSGEKGSDGVKQISVGLGPLVRAQAETFPAVVIFPQVPAGEHAQRHSGAIMRLIDRALGGVNADSNRITLTGLSSGGVLAYDIALHYPGRFAALVPVAAKVSIMRPDSTGFLAEAEANAKEAQALLTTPVWIFHGAQDGTAPVRFARAAVAAFKAAGVPVRYTEYPDAPHIIWDRVYQTPELVTWLLAQHR